VFPFPPTPTTASPAFIVCSLVIAILTKLTWNLYIVLIFISFIVKYVEHFFVYLLNFFWELFNSFAHLLIRVCALFWYLIFRALYMFWILIPCLTKIFSHCVCCLFILIIVFFDQKKVPFVNSCSYFLSNWSPIQKVIASAYIFL
jgi:hypothetical protein